MSETLLEVTAQPPSYDALTLTLTRPAFLKELAEQAQRAVAESLWAATSVANQLPDGVLAEAQTAFTRGFNVAAGASAGSIAVLAVAAAVALRHVGKTSAPPADSAEDDTLGNDQISPHVRVMDTPPSTRRKDPVVKDAASEAR